MRAHFLKPLFFCLSLATTEALATHCIYLNAYSPGYDWSDRIQQQFQKDAQQQCRITPYYLDAKHSSHEQLQQKGQEIAELIKLAKPDIVIAADDASSQYVVQPYLRNSHIPVVYIGINWDPTPYGYPMDNATGMTEVWPTHEVLRILRHTVKSVHKLAVISADSPLERTDSHYIEQAAQQHQLAVEHIFVRNFNDWKKAVVKAQNADAIYMGTSQAITGWNESQAIEWVKTHNQRFTFASQDFMRPYVMFSLSKSPEEFGRWAAKLTAAILAGTQPWQLPIIPNQQFIPNINESLLSLSPYELPAHIKRNAIVYRLPAP